MYHKIHNQSKFDNHQQETTSGILLSGYLYFVKWVEMDQNALKWIKMYEIVLKIVEKK